MKGYLSIFLDLHTPLLERLNFQSCFFSLLNLNQARKLSLSRRRLCKSRKIDKYPFIELESLDRNIHQSIFYKIYVIFISLCSRSQFISLFSRSQFRSLCSRSQFISLCSRSQFMLLREFYNSTCPDCDMTSYTSLFKIILFPLLRLTWIISAMFFRKPSFALYYLF